MFPPGRPPGHAWRGIRGRLGDSKVDQHALGIFGEPANMSGLDYDLPWIDPSEKGKKLRYDLLIENKLRGCLKKYRTQLLSEKQGSIKKWDQVILSAGQRSFMGEGSRCFDREAKGSRHGVCPSFPSGSTMRATEGCVDLRALENIRIALKIRIAAGKIRAPLSRNRPPPRNRCIAWKPFQFSKLACELSVCKEAMATDSGICDFSRARRAQLHA